MLWLRALSLYLMLVALAVGAHYIITPLYHPGGDAPFPAWEVMNWFMAPAVLAALIYAFVRKRALDRPGSAESSVKHYLKVTFTFYAAAWLFLWFFWNWVKLLAGQPEGSLWEYIDPLFVLTTGAVGWQMWPAQANGGD